MIGGVDMDKNRCEVFGQLNYDDTLTYEELLTIEDSLIEKVQAILQKACGLHIDFSPIGDCLLFQAAFEAYKIYIFRKIAQEIAAILPSGVNGRFACLEKSLSSLHVFWISSGQWQEEERGIPDVPPENLKIRKVPVVPLNPEVDEQDCQDS